jgi:hypothetical protein
MAVDGVYQVEIKSPMGPMAGTITLRTEAGSLSGSVAGQMGGGDFSGGTVNGDEAAWSMEVPGPIGKMKVTCRVTVSGDDISGEVKAGFFGSFPLQGKRA